jgi:hypothetical protein
VWPTSIYDHFRTTHQEAYIQSRKREETIIKELVETRMAEKPFGGWLNTMKPQLKVDYQCALATNLDYGRKYAMVDFAFPAENVTTPTNTLLMLEVDEGQHRWEAQSCETARMYNCTTTWLLNNASAPPKVVWIRYNPHGFQVDGVTKRTTKVERQVKLLALMDELAAETPDADVPQVRIIYMFYSTQDGMPCVLLDEDYYEDVKPWLWRTII